MVNLSKTLFSIQNSKYFAGLMILFLNLGSKYLALELSETQEQLLSNKIIRRFIIFTVVFVSTRDIWVSLITTAVFIVLVSGLFNENSKYCIITKPVITQVTHDDFTEAQKVIKLFTMQKEAEKKMLIHNKNSK